MLEAKTKVIADRMITSRSCGAAYTDSAALVLALIPVIIEVVKAIKECNRPAPVAELIVHSPRALSRRRLRKIITSAGLHADLDCDKLFEEILRIGREIMPDELADVLADPLAD